MNEVVDFARRGHFETIDITGGSPELHPRLIPLIEKLSPLTPSLWLRTNLTLLTEDRFDRLLEICRDYRVVLIASLPSVNTSQTESQRGDGVFEKSIAALRRLNSCGYGLSGTDLTLKLVSNPSGAFLPASQSEAENKFRRELSNRWEIQFNQLLVLTNVPLGRFRRWLVQSGNYEPYMEKLAAQFNPVTIKGLMCRTFLSVSWDGYLYDCDFNQAVGLPLGRSKIHVSAMDKPPMGGPIATSDHCYACTAGAGFSCGGAIVV